MAIIGGGNSSGGGSVIDPGMYRAKITAADYMPDQINRFYNPNDPKSGGPTKNEVHITFEVIADIEGDASWAGEELSWRITSTTGPNAHLLALARSAFQDPMFPEYGTFDTDDLLNKIVFIDVALGKQRSVDEDGQPVYWRNVTGCKPVPVKKGKPKPQIMVEPATDDEFDAA